MYTKYLFIIISLQKNIHLVTQSLLVLDFPINQIPTDYWNEYCSIIFIFT